MSPQHDYVIDNSTGANVRSDINSVLQAIASNNSGSSAPSTTYAFQLFADTTNNVMKIRNAANNAFIELFQLDGTFTLEDGSASTPALAFRDDLNTGIFSGGADEFNISTGGTERFVINSSGNVGIGTTSPARKLHLNESGTGTAVYASFTNGTTGAAANNGLNIGINAFQNAILNNYSNTNIVVLNNGAERLRIDNQGQVGIGTSSPSEKLNVSGNILATGTITPNSDIAFKKDIKPLTNVLNKVTQLLGINFTYKNNNEKSMGLVAQDVEKVFPELVRGEEGNKSLNYMGLTGALIEAIKELSARIEALEAA